MKKDFKKIVTLIVLCSVLTGCNKDENISYNDTNIESNIEHIESNTEHIENEPKNTPNQEFMYHKDIKKTMDEYVSNNDYEAIKKEGKKYIVNAIDFIFFDKPINGCYFKELPAEMKADFLDTIEYIDSVIVEYDPDYKESLGEKYKIASEFIHDKYLYVLDTIREYLGNEDYEAITRIKNKVKEDLGEILSNGGEFIKDKASKGKDYIKDKYINWRNK